MVVGRIYDLKWFYCLKTKKTKLHSITNKLFRTIWILLFFHYWKNDAVGPLTRCFHWFSIFFIWTISVIFLSHVNATVRANKAIKNLSVWKLWRKTGWNLPFNYLSTKERNSRKEEKYLKIALYIQIWWDQNIKGHMSNT